MRGTHIVTIDFLGGRAFRPTTKGAYLLAVPAPLRLFDMCKLHYRPGSTAHSAVMWAGIRDSRKRERGIITPRKTQ